MYDLQNAYSRVGFFFFSLHLWPPLPRPHVFSLKLVLVAAPDFTYGTGSLPRIIPHYSRTVPER